MVAHPSTTIAQLAPTATASITLVRAGVRSRATTSSTAWSTGRSVPPETAMTHPMIARVPNPSHHQPVLPIRRGGGGGSPPADGATAPGQPLLCEGSIRRGRGHADGLRILGPCCSCPAARSSQPTNDDTALEGETPPCMLIA